VPVLLVASGGSERHSMMLDHALRPLFAHFQAHVLPVSVYGSSGDFIETTLYNPPVLGRIERAAGIAASLLQGQRHRRAVAKVVEPIVA
jgi:FMN reductase